ncbi:MAG: hypothetical protein JSR61_02680 [Proteobacteria bacterium]|nr:hypothetical protein [Pseudomonadota bacterium]
MTAETEDLLRAILAELRTLNARLAPAPPAEADAALLRAVVSAAGRRAFSSREVFELGASRADLAAAFETSGVDDARKLGKALQRLAGQRIGGVLVSRVGQDGAGSVWRVDRMGVVGVTPATPTKVIAPTRAGRE